MNAPNQYHHLKICSNCILPESFPGVKFNEDGVCNYCQKFSGKEQKLQEDKKLYEQKFQDLLNQLGQSSQGPYDVLMAYSGGKDSTYTMHLLKEKYKLRVLAFSLDNGFISEMSHKNISEVVDKLGIDHIMFKPRWDILKKVFTYASKNEMYSKKTLERASTICTSCIGLVKSLCLKTSIEQNIPMIGFGWSPGQAPVQSAIMKNNPSLIKMTQRAMIGPLEKVVGGEIGPYFLNDWHYAQADRFPYNVHPMAWEFYEEKMIIEEIGKLGWKEPEDTDTNSSNCLLNAFANEVHLGQFGFHPYVWEIANMVREGVMPREMGHEKIYNEQREDLIIPAKEKLGLQKH